MVAAALRPGLALAVLGLALLIAGGSRLAAANTPPIAGARGFSIARLKYGGGGDWYEDRTSLVNLLKGVRDRTSIPVSGDQEAVVEPGAATLFQHPFVFACGHGNIKLTPTEVTNLRRWLDAGGFLWVDDDFGFDASLRREMKRVYPEAEFVELPFAHPIFHALYDFPQGLPKIHEHSGGPPKAFAIVHDGRLAVLYTHDTDLGDGLEDEDVHHDPPEKREAALRMALNIVQYALTH